MTQGWLQLLLKEREERRKDQERQQQLLQLFAQAATDKNPELVLFCLEYFRVFISYNANFDRKWTRLTLQRSVTDSLFSKPASTSDSVNDLLMEAAFNVLKSGDTAQQRSNQR